MVYLNNYQTPCSIRVNSSHTGRCKTGRDPRNFPKLQALIVMWVVVQPFVSLDICFFAQSRNDRESNELRGKRGQEALQAIRCTVKALVTFPNQCPFIQFIQQTHRKQKSIEVCDLPSGYIHAQLSTTSSCIKPTPLEIKNGKIPQPVGSETCLDITLLTQLMRSYASRPMWIFCVHHHRHRQQLVE